MIAFTDKIANKSENQGTLEPYTVMEHAVPRVSPTTCGRPSRQQRRKEKKKADSSETVSQVTTDTDKKKE